MADVGTYLWWWRNGTAQWLPNPNSPTGGALAPISNGANGKDVKTHIYIWQCYTKKKTLIVECSTGKYNNGKTRNS
jgi:hypothetical protein